MSEFLPTYTFGVDVAMWKLRPGAVYQLEGTNFTQWEDPQGLEPPTWAEVMAQVEADAAAAAELDAQHKAAHEGVAQQVMADHIPPENLPPLEVTETYHPTGLENAPPQPIAVPASEVADHGKM